MPNKNKQKGNSFEREFANYLTKFYGESFTRVPNSGALIGGLNHHRVETLSANQIRMAKGDLIPPASFPKLVVECKSYADLPFHKFLCNEPIKKVETWIGQTKECCEEGDVWILAIKINRKGTYILWDFWESRMADATTIGIPYNYRYRVSDIDTFFSALGTTLKDICK